ncbi:ectoine synthase [Pelagibius litoralis]|uniref:L-ectoine synthase n=1 Tax=Pelagibius litoralis TaxID=374515 RepID=A0A967EZT9_9PROT|nr:ectoine synthase [Pelagibius litoralis]NIA70419.1 ectoine synthase [Pelagibius litoralis]
MFVRSLRDVEATDFHVDWGNGTSHRLLTEKDGMGYTVCHTVVRAGSESLLQYRNHLEACYCIDGEGEVEDMNGNVYPIKQGDIYVLDQNDRHYLRSGKNKDLVLVSVFNPPLRGTEKHDLTKQNGSAY